MSIFYRSLNDTASAPGLRKKAKTSWKKPSPRPAGFVALPRPLSTARNNNSNNRLCVVLRFWRANGERNRYVCYIPADCVLSSPVFHKLNYSSALQRRRFLNVSKAVLLSMSAPRPSLDRTDPGSSFGNLHGGEPYFIFRFFIYWDGF